MNGRRAAAADRGLNVEAIRKEFPTLAQRVHGHPLVYLDSAATAQRFSGVLDAMDEFYRRDNANPHSEIHELETAARASSWIFSTVHELDRFVDALEELRG